VALEPGGVTIRPGTTGGVPASYTYRDVTCKEYQEQPEAVHVLDKNPLVTIAGWVRWAKGKIGT
jgi:hypothetical protein